MKQTQELDFMQPHTVYSNGKFVDDRTIRKLKNELETELKQGRTNDYKFGLLFAIETIEEYFPDEIPVVKC